MAQDTFDVSWTGDISGAKKMMVLEWRTSPYPIANPPSEVFDTLMGKTAISFGVGKKTWDFDALVTVGGYATGHITLAEVRTYLFESVDPAQNLYKIRDQEGTVYTAVLTNKSDPTAVKPAGRIAFGNAAAYRVSLKFREAP